MLINDIAIQYEDNHIMDQMHGIKIVRILVRDSDKFVAEIEKNNHGIMSDVPFGNKIYFTIVPGKMIKDSMLANR